MRASEVTDADDNVTVEVRMSAGEARRVLDFLQQLTIEEGGLGARPVLEDLMHALAGAKLPE